MTIVTKPLDVMLREINVQGHESGENRILTPFPGKKNSRGFSEAARDALVTYAAPLVVRAESLAPSMQGLDEVILAVGLSMWDIVINLHKRDLSLPFTHHIYHGTNGYVIRTEGHPSRCRDVTQDFPTIPNDPSDEDLHYLAWVLVHPTRFQATQDRYRQGTSIQVMDLSGIEPELPRCERSVLPLNYRPSSPKELLYFLS